MERYDLAIVGSGPAGLSAALNAKIRNKKFIIFGNKDLSNKINNYLGFYGMNGAEIKEKFAEHIDNMGIQITEERVNNIYAMGDYFGLMVNDKMYEATAVILATGMEYTKPINGEIELLAKEEAEEEANYVSELAGKVYYIPMYKGEYDLRDNIEVIDKKPLEIVGDTKVSSLKLEGLELETDGVFVLKDSISPGQLVPGLEIVDGHINVDREMKCNIPGCFAAGDCVGKPYQYIKSAGEGNIAALSAVRYIDIMKNK